MKLLFAFVCLIGTICAFHIPETDDFNVVITDVKVGKVPDKYNFKKWDEDLVPILSEIALEMEKKSPLLDGSGTVINDYADKVFANIQQLMAHQGYDPVELPDQHTGFNYTLIITYHGELDLTKGWLYDISSIHRGGDVIVSYSSSKKYMEVTIPITFDDLQFNYDYKAKIMGLGPVGGLAGKIKNIGVEVKIGFDVIALNASLNEFSITNSGHIDINFNGNPLVDWLFNLLTDVTTTLLKPVILLVVEGIIRGGLNEVVSAINDLIDHLLHPDPITTPAPNFFLS